jgi:hypothetical protein
MAWMIRVLRVVGWQRPNDARLPFALLSHGGSGWWRLLQFFQVRCQAAPPITFS